MRASGKTAQRDTSDVTGFTPVTSACLMSALGGKRTLDHKHEWGVGAYINLRYPTAVGLKETSSKEAARDALCLITIIALSAIPYVTNLGFYSDDWGLFAGYHFHGFDGLVGTFPGRPVQAAYSAFLFSLFGMQPLGYHIVNTAVIGAGVVLLYALLIRLRFSRAEAFAVSVVFALLPQLSTIRVWIAAAQIPLSMSLALASLHAQLTFARTAQLRFAFVALVAAILSAAAYEIFIPLIAGFALMLMWVSHRNRRAVAFTVGVGALLALVVVYKVALSGRAGPITDASRYLKGLFRLVSPEYDWREDSGLNVFAALEVHFWLPLKGWAKALLDLQSGQSTLLTGLAAIAIASLCLWRLSGAGTERVATLRLLFLGVAVFAAGHMTFLVVPSILFAPTGMANRVLIASAIGAAMVLVAALGLATRVTPVLFSPAVAFVAFCAMLRLSQVENYWVQAPAIQRNILAVAKVALRKLPHGSTVILDGVCPYHGPAVVLETSWDVGGALSLALGRELNGDAVSPRMSVTPGGLHTSIYKEPAFFPYGANLYIYNPNLHVVAPLTSEANAQSYFRRPGRWPVPCPRGYVGHGVLI